MPPSSVHFNGSVNLPDAETVMQEISSRIPTGVRRMTDGETGERGYWILFQIQKFLAMPEFESVTAGQAYETSEDAPQMPQLRLAEGASADTISWPNLGYADAYAESFEIFERLQKEGTIAAGVRFQMQYPTPLASMAGTIVPEDLPAVAASYERALFADLDKLLAKLPRDRCAVQWDVAVEFGLLEGAMGPGRQCRSSRSRPGWSAAWTTCPGTSPSACISVMATTATSTSSSPSPLQMQVDLLNAVTSSAQRPVNWASFTVPQARSDADYFAPLRDLTAGPETELYFALVPYHPDDQPDGTTAAQIEHIDAALADHRPGARVGDLHGVRDGTRGRRRRAQTARSPPRDPRDLSRPALRATSSNQSSPPTAGHRQRRDHRDRPRRRQPMIPASTSPPR